MFIDGEYLDHSFATEPEPLSVLAQIAIDGNTLELRNLVVYSGAGNVRVSVGVAQLLAILNEVGQLARASGYAWLLITGQRLTGANPGHAIRVRRRLE